MQQLLLSAPPKPLSGPSSFIQWYLQQTWPCFTFYLTESQLGTEEGYIHNTLYQPLN